MILHLVDDEKIVNKVISVFEETLPNKNIFVCFLIEKNETNKPQLVNQANNVHFVYDENSSLAIDFSSVTKVLIHFLSYKKIVFFNKFVKHKVPCYWLLWGADLYNSLLVTRGLDVYYESQYLPWIIRLFNVVRRLGYVGRSERVLLSFLKKNVSCFISDCEQEYLLMKQYLGDITSRISYLPFFYYSIDAILGEHLVNAEANGHFILVGNSGSFTNNHCYAMEYLSKLSLGNKQIVTPISYGGSPKYLNHIKAKGKKLFGDHFSTLEKFLPLADYNALMAKSEVCIYGSWRQEAAGNILIALYLGAKVFLSRRSPLLPWFKELGIVIFELESISEEQLHSRLSDKEKQNNRLILINRYNKERQMQLINKYWGE